MSEEIKNKRFKKKREFNQEKKDGFDSSYLNLRRVNRMFKGGKRLAFSSFVVVGDREGKVGVALGKAPDPSSAQKKAVARAKKNSVNISLKGNTIPHEITYKYKSTKIMLKPAAPGTGVVASPTVKQIVELAGIKDLLTKIHGSTNQVNTAYATFNALKSLRDKRV